MKKTKSKKGSGAKTALAVGAGAVALGTLAYLLYGPEGKKNRKKINDWTEEMKRDIHKKLVSAKNLSKKTYEGIVDEVSTLYQKEKRATKAELAKLAKEIKGRWGSKTSSASPRKTKAKSKTSTKAKTKKTK